MQQIVFVYTDAAEGCLHVPGLAVAGAVLGKQIVHILQLAFHIGLSGKADAADEIQTLPGGDFTGCLSGYPIGDPKQKRGRQLCFQCPVGDHGLMDQKRILVVGHDALTCNAAAVVHLLCSCPFLSLCMQRIPAPMIIPYFFVNFNKNSFTSW